MPVKQIKSSRKIISSLIGGVSVLGGLLIAAAVSAPVVDAQPDPARVINALSYPRASDRFFAEGRQQFETEVEQLQRRSLSRLPELKIKPEVLEQQRRSQQDQDRLLREQLRRQSSANEENP